MRIVAAAALSAQLVVQLLASEPARAQERTAAVPRLGAPPELLAPDALAAQQLESELRWRKGVVPLGDGLGTLELGDAYHFLGRDDALRVLVEAWQSPAPEPPPLGLVFAAGVGAFTPGGFAALVEWTQDGHVSDAGASELDAAALLGDAQATLESGNAERRARGLPPLQLLGWAAPPRYDREAHALTLAHELAVGDGPAHALHYDLHLLARRGVLTLRATATLAELDAVRAHMAALQRRVVFAPGHRYADFDSNADDVATYGVTGLLAGGLLANAGAWKLALGALAATKKWLVLAALAGFGLLARQVARRRAARA